MSFNHSAYSCMKSLLIICSKSDKVTSKQCSGAILISPFFFFFFWIKLCKVINSVHRKISWIWKWTFCISFAQSHDNDIKTTFQKALFLRCFTTLYSWNTEGTKPDENTAIIHKMFETKGLFIWRWAGPVRRVGLSTWDDFYPTFIWNLLSQFNQKSVYVVGKILFDQVVFTINSDVKPSCRTNVLILFN